MKTRDARLEDAEEISAFLKKLVELGKRRSPSDADFVRDVYISHPGNIACTVAEDDRGAILGIQILLLATPGNPSGVEPGGGIIGTHVNPKAARRGVGAMLFSVTRAAARKAGVRAVEATIGANSPEAQAYYEAMGFVTFGSDAETVRKRFDVT